MMKEIPRCLLIYDVDMSVVAARKAITYHFRKHEHLKDARCVVYCNIPFDVARIVILICNDHM